jgi:hypothetical protein
MTVRAKFAVNRKSQSLGSTKDDKGNWIQCVVNTIEMSPVYGNNDPEHENSKFWAATPSGKLELGVIPEEVGNVFEIGKEYYIDITEAPKK